MAARFADASRLQASRPALTVIGGCIPLFCRRQRLRADALVTALASRRMNR